MTAARAPVARVESFARKLEILEKLRERDRMIRSSRSTLGADTTTEKEK